MVCLDPLVDTGEGTEEGSRGVIVVTVEVRIVESIELGTVEGFVEGIAVGIAGILGNLVGWW